LQENGSLDLLELQDASQHLSWKAANIGEVTFACYLANKLDIRVEGDLFHPDLITSAPNATLAALACQVKLSPPIQIKEEMTAAICLKTESDLTRTILAGDRQHSILLDGQAQNPGLPLFHAATAKPAGSMSSQAWLRIQNPRNGQRELGPSGSLKYIAVSRLALIGRDPRTPSPQFKRGQRQLAMVMHWWANSSHTLIRFQSSP